MTNCCKLKFSKSATGRLEQSICVPAPKRHCFHPIRVMHHEALGPSTAAASAAAAAAGIVQAAALLSTLLTSGPAILHRKAKLWMTCKSLGVGRGVRRLGATCLRNGMATRVHQWRRVAAGWMEGSGKVQVPGESAGGVSLSQAASKANGRQSNFL